MKSILPIAAVYLSLNILLFQAARWTDPSIAPMTTLTTLLIASLWPVTRLLRRKMPILDQDMSSLGVTSALSIFAAAYVPRFIFLSTFGFPWEKAAVAYLVVLTVLVVNHLPPSRIGLHLQHAPRDLLTGLAVGSLYVGLSYGVTHLLTFQLGSGLRFHINFDAWHTSWYILFTLSTAFSEEALFRGYIISAFSSRLKTSSSLIGSSLLFGLWHTALPLAVHRNEILTPLFAAELTYRVATSAVWGTVAAMLYFRTRSLAASFMMHVTWNTLVTIFILAPESLTILQLGGFMLLQGLAGVALYVLVERLVSRAS